MGYDTFRDTASVELLERFNKDCVKYFSESWDDYYNSTEEYWTYQVAKEQSINEAAEKYATLDCGEFYNEPTITGKSLGEEAANDFKEGALWMSKKLDELLALVKQTSEYETSYQFRIKVESIEQFK